MWYYGAKFEISLNLILLVKFKKFFFTINWPNTQIIPYINNKKDFYIRNITC